MNIIRRYIRNIMEPSTKDVFINLIGLSPQKADETITNPGLTQRLLEVIQTAKTIPGFSGTPDHGKLLYSLASQAKATKEHRDFLISYIVSGRLPSVPQLDAAGEFLRTHSIYTTQEFEEYSGIGVQVTESQIREAVEKVFSEDSEKIKSSKWSDKTLLGGLLKRVRALHKWGDARLAKQLIEEKLISVLGPQPSEEDLKKDKKKKAPVFEEPSKKEKLSTCIGRDLKSAVNSESLLKKHLEFTKGKVMTRFPPEPNGYLHLGHAKAMRFSFKMAEESGGQTYLRFDDTNPDKESEEYIENIKKNVNWLGYTPWMITHASQYFPEMYDLAVELIKRGKAYVDEQPWALIKEQRANKINSPHRDSPVEENLKKFERMKKGYYGEGEACLRMKIDMSNNNTTMRDPVAYRVKFTPHPHVGDLWCVYPTYDFEHCIVDSIENITHSLCTLEFEIRRDPYYWLLEALDLYRASVWEYSRLNISQTVMSKRKLQKLVEEKFVKGWDDPRLPTLNGLRRRGYTAQAINDFVDTVGVARTGNENIISINLLEHCIRKELDNDAPRTMAVVDPIEVLILNIKETSLEIPVFPKHPEGKKYSARFSEKIFIERDDFLEVDKPGFFGLSLNKVVGLKYIGLKIKCLKVVKDGEKVVRLECEVVEDQSKPKGILHWISEHDAVRAEVRVYETLFLSNNPSAIEDWLSDLNPNSLTVHGNSLVHRHIAGSNVEDKFQFERVGYFVVDPDSNEERKVFNRIVTLVETKKKKAN
jgi:glutaminyl-tRNA synthetase